ncbi:putative START-like domain-containing protein [Medicago truncatula]|uniref:Putative START-like domain-containing protein n=1 Tax=Medicago truncatula TaxID=3880 RepID=A0A072VIP0_MEDTR|nr:uncharacterized protein LOC25483662 isoform X3 [Medicago truncatula]KEH41854.1 START-2 domain protein [Medicago truncatula]RHN79388.1 putative START-like domain-containing protein [Medicago truncatula]
MEKKRKIVQYRERLDKTLASPDLTNVEILKKLVKSQLLPSSELEDEEYKEKFVEHKTAEISNFLDMLRSTSDEHGRSNTSQNDWKLKQDGEEFRVMYREGPEGTPFHTMLVEGFVDGPVDVCLCISWQTSLYKKWWPQSTIPTFKILSCECLQKVQIGEQISLVRMKVSWPLSSREAVVHYYLFEYFQDDLIVVLTNSVPESKSINNEKIPEEKDVVRVDLVGGFALQKVTSERSYFRTIANMDIKVDFVPPSLINFISRQLIGNGFRLYQKVVASVMSSDKEEFSKALGDPLYARIREALYSTTTSASEVANSGELQQVAKIHPAEYLVESKPGGEKDASEEDKISQCANNDMSPTMDATELENSKAFGEIVELDKEDIIQSVEDDEKVSVIPNKEVGTIAQKGKSIFIRSDVKQAIETLDKAISMIREYRLHSEMASTSFANEESPCMEEIDRVDSYSTKIVKPSDKNGVPNKDILKGTSQEAPSTNSDIQNLRYSGIDPNLKEINPNKVIPTLSEQGLAGPTEASQVGSYSLDSGAIMDQTTCQNKQPNTDLVQDMSSDDKVKSRRLKKTNNNVTRGMSSNVPKKLSGYKKYMCFGFLH